MKTARCRLVTSRRRPSGESAIESIDLYARDPPELTKELITRGRSLPCFIQIRSVQTETPVDLSHDRDAKAMSLPLYEAAMLSRAPLRSRNSVLEWPPDGGSVTSFLALSLMMIRVAATEDGGRTARRRASPSKTMAAKVVDRVRIRVFVGLQARIGRGH